MKNINTIVFDLDGTLLNTLEDLADSVNFAMGEYGYPERGIEEVKSFVGNGVRNLMELATPEGLNNQQFEECLDTFREHYSKNMYNKTRPYDGIMELLEELSKNNFKAAIVSNKFDRAVKELTKDYFENYISVAIGESAGVHKKPAPDCVFAALEELAASRDEAIYVGDSEVDVETARNAGLKCVGVTWGFRSRELLITEGADYIIDEPSELIDILKG